MVPTTTLEPTTTTVPLAPEVVPGPVTPATSLGVGDATLIGTVAGPDGPVDGVTVRVERVTGDTVISADVVAATGTWRLASIPGGPYRVRAFRTPDFGQPQPEEFFLGGSEQRSVDLRLTRYDGDAVEAVVEPNPPFLDEPLILTIRIRASRVDAAGRPTATPRSGLGVQLNVEGLTLESPRQVTTDAGGAALWRLRCTTPGTTAVAVAVGEAMTKVNLPACVPRPPPTTTTLPPIIPTSVPPG